eukprot:gene585-1806_t
MSEGPMNGRPEAVVRSASNLSQSPVVRLGRSGRQAPSGSPRPVFGQSFSPRGKASAPSPTSKYSNKRSNSPSSKPNYSGTGRSSSAHNRIRSISSPAVQGKRDAWSVALRERDTPTQANNRSASWSHTPTKTSKASIRSASARNPRTPKSAVVNSDDIVMQTQTEASLQNKTTRVFNLTRAERCDVRCGLTVGSHVWLVEREGGICIRDSATGEVVSGITAEGFSYAWTMQLAAPACRRHAAVGGTGVPKARHARRRRVNKAPKAPLN